MTQGSSTRPRGKSKPGHLERPLLSRNAPPPFLSHQDGKLHCITASASNPSRRKTHLHCFPSGKMPPTAVGWSSSASVPFKNKTLFFCPPSQALRIAEIMRSLTAAGIAIGIANATGEGQRSNYRGRWLYLYLTRLSVMEGKRFCAVCTAVFIPIIQALV